MKKDDKIISPDDENFQIILNYELLDDSYALFKSNTTNSTFFTNLENMAKIAGGNRKQETKDWCEAEIYDENYRLIPEAEPYSPSTTVIQLNHPLMIMVKEERVVSILTSKKRCS